jgi:hypothetical protein
MLVKALHAVFADSEDLRVHGIGVLGGDGGHAGNGWECEEPDT